MDGAEFRYIDFAIRADGQLQVLDGGTIDVNDQHVARTYDVVLGRGDIHVRRKRQSAVVEDVAAKDLTAGATTPSTPEPFGIVALHVALCVVSHQVCVIVELRRGVVGRLDILACIINGSLQAIVNRTGCTSLINLVCILAAEALQLLWGSALLQQRRRYLPFRGTGAFLVDGTAYDLTVADTAFAGS